MKQLKWPKESLTKFGMTLEAERKFSIGTQVNKDPISNLKCHILTSVVSNHFRCGVFIQNISRNCRWREIIHHLKRSELRVVLVRGVVPKLFPRKKRELTSRVTAVKQQNYFSKHLLRAFVCPSY